MVFIKYTIIVIVVVNSFYNNPHKIVTAHPIVAIFCDILHMRCFLTCENVNNIDYYLPQYCSVGDIL